MRLTRAEAGREYLVRSPGRTKESRNAITRLGLTTGTKIKVVYIRHDKTVITRARGASYAVGRGYAEQIEVDLYGDAECGSCRKSERGENDAF